MLFFSRKSSSCCLRLIGLCRYLQLEHSLCLKAQSGHMIESIGQSDNLCRSCSFNSCGVLPGVMVFRAIPDKSPMHINKGKFVLRYLLTLIDSISELVLPTLLFLCRD